MNFDKIIYDKDAIELIEQKAKSYYNNSIPIRENVFNRIEENNILLLYPVEDACDGFFCKKAY